MCIYIEREIYTFREGGDRPHRLGPMRRGARGMGSGVGRLGWGYNMIQSPNMQTVQSRR